MKFEKILYPTDFSEKTKSARNTAADLAGSMDSKIFILHAIEPLRYEEFDDEIETFYKDLQMKLKEKMDEEAEFFDSMGLRTHSSFIIGPRWKVINTYAKEMDVGLIVMGSHGLKDNAGKMLVGTTSHKVIFTSPCPVLVVRNDYEFMDY